MGTRKLAIVGKCGSKDSIVIQFGTQRCCWRSRWGDGIPCRML